LVSLCVQYRVDFIKSQALPAIYWFLINRFELQFTGCPKLDSFTGL
jgi:hypothetical protein